MPGEPYRVQVPRDELIQLLTRYGVITPPALWYLENSIQPVSIVDSRIALTATSTSGLFTLATAGELTAPVINTVMADTGQLAAGDWEFFFWISGTSGGNNNYRWEHRNAANSASLNSHLFEVPGNTTFYVPTFRFTIALNERFRILNTLAGSGTTQVTIWRRQV